MVVFALMFITHVWNTELLVFHMAVYLMFVTGDVEVLNIAVLVVLVTGIVSLSGLPCCGGVVELLFSNIVVLVMLVTFVV